VIVNVLYVTNGDTDAVTAYSPADALTDAQAPDFFLGGPSGLEAPLAIAGVPGRLFVGNRSGDIGLSGFDDPATLVTGNRPDVTFDTKALIEDCPEIESFLRSLWVISDTFGAVYGYRDATSIISDQFADIILYDPTMSQATSLVVRERE
jgi:hypothetical protein